MTGGVDKGACVNRVLITRPEPGATQTARRLAALGFEPVVAPVMTIVPAETPVRLPGQFAATVLTSRNAVPACPAACLDRPAFTVGSATAARAREAGFTRVIDADADAAALPGVIAATLGRERQRLFLPTGLGQGTDLAKALRDQGFRVLRRVAYRAAPVAALPEAALRHLQNRNIQIALFFSGETARAFVRLILAAGLTETVADIEAVSISERSAMALRGLPWRRISVAARPNQDAMLVLLK